MSWLYRSWISSLLEASVGPVGWWCPLKPTLAYQCQWSTSPRAGVCLNTTQRDAEGKHTDRDRERDNDASLLLVLCRLQEAEDGQYCSEAVAYPDHRDLRVGKRSSSSNTSRPSICRCFGATIDCCVLLPACVPTGLPACPCVSDCLCVWLCP